MTEIKPNLLNFDRGALETLFADMGEQRFRASQAMKWIYSDYELDFHQFTNFSKTLREKMADRFSTAVPELISENISADGTIKWLLKMDSDNAIETVYIPEKNRGTLCVSSQVGCSLNCTFCATGAQGFNRHLTTAEIIAQVWVAAKQLNHHTKNRRITNIVMMGMGEPLANYERVLPALNIMRDDFAFGFANRRVTVSTSGLVPQILQLNKDADVSLAVSLHAANDELRTQLVPLNKKYNIEQLLGACKQFISGKRKSRITFEYTVIGGVNDSAQNARELTKLLRDIPCKINLIPFNSFPGTKFVEPSAKKVDQFKEICMRAGYICTVRKTRGDDIAAACGQLAGEFMDRTRRSGLRSTATEKRPLEVR